MKLPAALVATAFALLADHAVAASACVAAADSAQDLRATGKLREARAALVTCSRSTCNNVVRSDCEKWLKEVDAQMPSLVVRAVDQRGRDVVGVRVTIDDAPIDLDGTPVAVDPGQHVVRARAKSGDIAEQKTLVVLGEKARVLEIRFDAELTQDGAKPEPLKVTPQQPPDEPTLVKKGTSNLAPIIVGGVGVVALGVFGALEIVAQSNYRDLEDGCAKTPARCPASKVDPVRSQFVGAAVALGVSGLAFVAAGIIYIFTQKPDGTAGLRDGTIRF